MTLIVNFRKFKLKKINYRKLSTSYKMTVDILVRNKRNILRDSEMHGSKFHLKLIKHLNFLSRVGVVLPTSVAIPKQLNTPY
mgnify:CR=1 FL=1